MNGNDIATTGQHVNKHESTNLSGMDMQRQSTLSRRRLKESARARNGARKLCWTNAATCRKWYKHLLT
jgi:hypothetical protein